MIGCTAQITQVKPLTQGQMNITVVGQDRFEIVSLRHDKPYLTGMVEMRPIEPGDDHDLMKGANALRKWIERYLRVLERAGQIQFDPTQLPDEPQALANWGAVLLQGITATQKQRLLSAEHITDMISDLCGIYRHEVVMLEVLLSPPPELETPGLFSLN
jgi:Lon protease-like protein